MNRNGISRLRFQHVLSFGIGTDVSNVGGGWLFYDLRAGQYQVLVEDAIGCIGRQIAIIEDPPAVSGIVLVTANASDIGVADGSLAFNVTYGASPFTFGVDVSNSSAVPFTAVSSTPQIVNSLAAGFHYITVSDSLGCVGTINSGT